MARTERITIKAPPPAPLSAGQVRAAWRPGHEKRLRASNLTLAADELLAGLRSEARRAGRSRMRDDLEQPPAPRSEPPEPTVRVEVLAALAAPHGNLTITAGRGDVLDVPASLAAALEPHGRIRR